jgi:hypothetical protein
MVDLCDRDKAFLDQVRNLQYLKKGLEPGRLHVHLLRFIKYSNKRDMLLIR